MIVEVVEYNPAWVQLYKDEVEILEKQIENIIIESYHIGSTAVPNLKAKPIIDIMLEVSSLIELDKRNQLFEELGYEVMGELGIKGRRYFRKGGDNRTHQIHAFKSGDQNLIRHLAFRDYLRKHKEVAHEYGKLKSEIALRCNNDIEVYSNEKDFFVKYHEAIALTWYNRIDR